MFSSTSADFSVTSFRLFSESFPLEYGFINALKNAEAVGEAASVNAILWISVPVL